MKRTVILSSFIDEVCTGFVQTRLSTGIFVPFGLETSDRSKQAKCLSPRRGTNKIIYILFVLISCFAT